MFFLGMNKGRGKLPFQNFQTLPRSQDGMVWTMVATLDNKAGVYILFLKKFPPLPPQKIYFFFLLVVLFLRFI